MRLVAPADRYYIITEVEANEILKRAEAGAVFVPIEQKAPSGGSFTVQVAVRNIAWIESATS